MGLVTHHSPSVMAVGKEKRCVAFIQQLRRQLSHSVRKKNSYFVTKPLQRIHYIRNNFTHKEMLVTIYTHLFKRRPKVFAVTTKTYSANTRIKLSSTHFPVF